MERYTSSQAHQMLTLLGSVAREIRELRELRRELRGLLDDIEQADRISPEGFTEARLDIQTRLAEVSEANRRCLHELFRLGVYLHGTQPLVFHIPGLSRNRNVVFVWMEGQDTLQILGPLGPEPLSRESGRTR